MFQGIPIEIQIALRHSNPDYKAGYEDGFLEFKKALVSDLKDMIKKIEKMEAYTEYTTTVTTK